MAMDPVATYAIRQHPAAKRIVEVGVGHDPQTARTIAIAMPGCEVLATDVDMRALAKLSMEPFRAVRDDITEPDLRRYTGAALMYANRPPPELVPYMERVAAEVGAELVCVHLTEETGWYRENGWEPMVDGGTVVAWRRPVQMYVRS